MVRLDFGGALEGGATGAYAGSPFGTPGMIAGAAIGAGSKLFKKKKKKKPLPRHSTLDPQQEALQNDSISSIRGEGPFNDLYEFDAEGYNDVFDQTVGRPAYRNFEENIIPKVTGQFRSGNIMNSSYTGETLSRAGRDVQEGLDAQRSSNVFAGQQQAKESKRQDINNVLNRQTFAYGEPEQQGQGSSIDRIISSLGPDVGDWLSGLLKDLNKSKRSNTPRVA